MIEKIEISIWQMLQLKDHSMREKEEDMEPCLIIIVCGQVLGVVRERDMYNR